MCIVHHIHVVHDNELCMPFAILMLYGHSIVISGKVHGAIFVSHCVSAHTQIVIQQTCQFKLKRKTIEREKSLIDESRMTIAVIILVL
jgi:hypothetical protein